MPENHGHLGITIAVKGGDSLYAQRSSFLTMPLVFTSGSRLAPKRTDGQELRPEDRHSTIPDARARREQLFIVPGWRVCMNCIYLRACATTFQPLLGAKVEVEVQTRGGNLYPRFRLIAVVLKLPLFPEMSNPGGEVVCERRLNILLVCLQLTQFRGRPVLSSFGSRQIS
ncbi:uncharacterized protein ARMOST_02322 [Armillaria ostoyae]|uniref:Uncharacterized protein n=1 Tax=Armillaria ostoyae TaxID=47428 RepID=A0A284QRD4_ARMOS|nr:uncharacterized protein ARMOST_02322 [Armillaria ostoyae]